MKKNDGITLIVLIITVIIMLILVAVTINVTINSGLIDSAKNAIQKTINSVKKEKQAGHKIDVDDTTYGGIEEFLNGEELVYGDMNGDGNVTSEDAEMLDSYLQEDTSVLEEFTKNWKVAADVNLDLKIDSTDVDLINQFVRGEITKLPVKE